jgi:hypothetical protein
MNKFKILIMAVGLLLIPQVYQVQSTQNSGTPPPVESVLVRQGDFALSLLEVLELGTAYSETQAQEMLAELGIEPKNGWVSDYPVTPDIIGELQYTVGKASEYGYLTINRSEALDIFQTLTADYGLPIIPDYSGNQYSETPPSFGSYNYTDPTVINNYYYHSGPPVVTYYPPPYGHYHLYNWVPYPFWWGNFWFSGYFVMNDFHRSSRVVILNKYGYKKHFRSPKRVIGVVSNRGKTHYRNPKRSVIQPSQRKFGGYRHPGNEPVNKRLYRPHKSGIRDNSPFFRRGHEQRRGPGNNTVIRGDKHSNERFRNDTKRQINNRSLRTRDHVNQGIERGTGSRPPRGTNPTEIRRPGNNRGSLNTPRTPAIHENRRNSSADIRNNRTFGVRENRRDNPVVRQNRTTTVRENRNPVLRENRRSFDRSRFHDGNQSFQGRDRNSRSSFQRPDRSGNGSSRSWNRDGRSSREFHQSGFSRGGSGN